MDVIIVVARFLVCCLILAISMFEKKGKWRNSDRYCGCSDSVFIFPFSLNILIHVYRIKRIQLFIHIKNYIEEVKSKKEGFREKFLSYSRTFQHCQRFFDASVCEVYVLFFRE